MRPALSEREAEALDYLRKYTDRNGFAPSYVEMAKQLDLASPSSAWYIVQSLERRGLVARIPGKSWRSVKVVGAPPPKARTRADAIVTAMTAVLETFVNKVDPALISRAVGAAQTALLRAGIPAQEAAEITRRLDKNPEI